MKELLGALDGHRGHLGQGAAGEIDMARLGAQPRPFATGARLVAEVFRQFFAHRVGFGLAVAAFHVGDDAFERMFAAGLGAAFVQINEFDFLVAAAVQNHLADLGRHVLEGVFHVEAVMARQRLQHVEVIHVAPVPAADRAAGEAQGGIDDHSRRVEELLHAQTVAGRAGPRRVVEGEQARLQLRQTVAAQRTGELGGKYQVVAPGFVDEGDARQSFAHGQRGFEGIRQALLHVGAHLEAVDHHLDAVFLAQIQLGHLVEFGHRAVDAGAHETLRA